MTPSGVKNAKPQSAPYKLQDGHGLFLLVQPTGAKWWRFRYRRPGTHAENLLSLGTFPEVSLRQARERRDDARKQLADGIDPGAKRKAATAAKADTFEALAREWYAKHLPDWAESHASKVQGRLERDAFPWLGGKPITEIKAADIRRVLTRIDERGARETAHRVQQYIGQVFRFAIATGRAEADPTVALRGAIPAAHKVHFATLTNPDKVGALLRALAGYAGSLVTRSALELAPLTFVRPGELRRAEWAEFDLERAEWRIPAAKMKMRRAHLVPLSRQALAILKDLRPLTGAGRYVFPSARTAERPMSENAVNGALRRLGFTKQEMTGHGFRAMASTLLNEQGWNPDVIELQLAHAERSEVRAAYNHAEHLTERRRMMQAWADYLDGLRTGSNVVAIKLRAGSNQ